MAKIYKGKLIDASDKSPIAYANIGIIGGNIGINSDENGNFSIEITEKNKNKKLSVFLIGYEQAVLHITDFIKRSETSQLPIEMHKKAVVLGEVIIKPTKLTFDRLGSYVNCTVETEKGEGLPFPYYLEEKKKKNGKIKQEADTLTEVGTLMKVKRRKTFIDSIEINVGKCTYEEIIYRINIYELINKEPTIILKEPIYIRKKKSEIGNSLKLDLTDKNLVVNNNFIVSIEKVKDMGEGALTICGKIGGPAAYLRIASLQEHFIKLPIISFGISAYVTFSEEIKN